MLDRVGHISDAEIKLFAPSVAPAGIEEREPIDQFEREAARVRAQAAAEARTRGGHVARWVEPPGEGAATPVPASVRASIREERKRVTAATRKGGER